MRNSAAVWTWPKCSSRTTMAEQVKSPMCTFVNVTKCPFRSLEWKMHKQSGNNWRNKLQVSRTLSYHEQDPVISVQSPACSKMFCLHLSCLVSVFFFLLQLTTEESWVAARQARQKETPDRGHEAPFVMKVCRKATSSLLWAPLSLMSSLVVQMCQETLLEGICSSFPWNLDFFTGVKWETSSP